MGSAAQTHEEEISGINVTPLVDVVLVLLVIFMITAPALYQNALKVHLPQAKSAEDQAKGTMEIAVEPSGQIVVQGKSFDQETFRAFVQTSKPTAAMIMADKKVEHGHVIGVIDTLKLVGVQKFSFGVEKAAN